VIDIVVSAIVVANMLTMVLAGLFNPSLACSVMGYTTLYCPMVCSNHRVRCISMGSTMGGMDSALLATLLPVLIFLMVARGFLLGDGGNRE
jgi:Na+/phosphate symporter